MKNYCKNKQNYARDKTIKLEKQIIELTNEVNQLKVNTINTINNGTINKNEIKEIFDKDLSSILTYVEKMNFNERLPSNHSFCTTNLEGPYLSVFNTKKLEIKKDRKKYFFEQLFSTAVVKLEELYKINKNYFNKEKQQSIENSLITLYELKNMDMNKRLFKEILKKFNLISYNDRTIVKNTWNNNEQNKIPNTFNDELYDTTDDDDTNDDDNEH
jgi:hypothetical protein